MHTETAEYRALFSMCKSNTRNKMSWCQILMKTSQSDFEYRHRMCQQITLLARLVCQNIERRH